MNWLDELRQQSRRVKESCKTPGMRIRSKGMGRGLGRGKGKGPLGIPVGGKVDAKG